MCSLGGAWRPRRGEVSCRQADVSPGRAPLQMSLCSFPPCLLHLHPLSELSQNLKCSCNCTGLDDERALRFGITHAKTCHTREHCVPWTRNPEEYKSNKISVVMRCVANTNFHDMLNNKNVSQEISTLMERNHMVLNQLSSIHSAFMEIRLYLRHCENQREWKVEPHMITLEMILSSCPLAPQLVQ